MPNRILREGILTSPRIAKLGWPEEVFYRRLMSVVDDFGRYYADPGMLRAACYPRQLGKVTDPDVGKWTRILVEAGLVRVYRAKDRECYIEMLDFRQQARAKASKFPDPHSECVADATQTTSGSAADAPVFGDVIVDGGGGESGARARAVAALPDWIPPDAWDAWVKFRGKSLTSHAKALCVAELARLMAEGHGPRDVIEQSIRNGWKGLFPVSGRTSASAKQSERAAVAAEIYGAKTDERRDERVIDGEAKRVA